MKAARQAVGLSQRAAAALIYASAGTLCDVERGRYALRPDRWELLRQKLACVTAEKLMRDHLREAADRLRNELGGRRVCDGASAGRAAARHSRYTALLRFALETSEPRPTLAQLAEWTGISIHSLRAWLKPLGTRSHRPVPRYALRLALWELAARDKGGTNWEALLRTC